MTNSVYSSLERITCNTWSKTIPKDKFIACFAALSLCGQSFLPHTPQKSTKLNSALTSANTMLVTTGRGGSSKTWSSYKTVRRLSSWARAERWMHHNWEKHHRPQASEADKQLLSHPGWPKQAHSALQTSSLSGNSWAFCTEQRQRNRTRRCCQSAAPAWLICVSVCKYIFKITLSDFNCTDT